MMTGFSWRVLILGAALALVVCGSTMAQSGVVSIYKVGGLKSGTTIDAGQNVRFLMRFNNTTGEKCDVSNGFKLSSPDGATWDSTTVDSVGPINDAGTPGDPSDDFNAWFNKYFDVTFSMRSFSADGLGADTVGVLGVGTPSKSVKQLPAAFNDSVYAITAWFDGKKTAGGKHLCIDSAFYGVGGTWKWVGKSLIDYFPQWEGLAGQPYNDGVGPDRLGSGYCFDIYAPALQLSTNALEFTTQLGFPAPPGQTFTVTSSGAPFGDNLAFSLVEASPWIVKTPASGTTPKTITVTMNTTGLTPGVYVDSIEVASTGAYNSPLWVKITLNLIAPPPTILASKSSFQFTGISGGANPAPQTFYIKNSGGGTLNWSLSKSSLWLGLTPSFGTDSNTVSVSVDLTGLSFGDHYDTIVVADPAATNTPVRIPVKLSIGSSLPVIETDSSVYHVIVDVPNYTPPRTINIRNGGVGTLTFTLTRSSDRLFTITPSSGTAPLDVTIQFKLIGGVVGQEYADTLWVTSPEAVNSPYPIVFRSKILDVPPVLALGKDTIRFVTYECPPPTTPQDTFLVYDSSGADPGAPTTAHFLNSTAFCTFSPAQATLPSVVIATAAYPALAPGVYYDTVFVGAEYAYHSPKALIIKYERYDIGPDPSLILSRSTFDVARQEQTGPALITFNVLNGGVGCLPWSVNEEVPWFKAQTESGNVPALFSGLLEVDGLTLGTYKDSFYVVAPAAPNSPKVVRLQVKMWRYHGDTNWDGMIDISDLSRLIAYLLSGSPLPLPTYIVGDVDCSNLVDLSDLSLLVAYLRQSTPLCGNP